LFTVLLPFSNIAWRVAVSSAVAGALSCGLVALIASRGCSMILERLDELKGLERRWENALCMSAGHVAGLLIGFNGFMWSQAVIVEVYPLSLLSFMVVLATLLRWVYAPDQLRYLYGSVFMFGVCFTNHQTLIVAAMGIEVAIAAARPRLGRDLFAINSLLFFVGLIFKAQGWVTAFDLNAPLYAIYLVIGVMSVGAYIFLAFHTGEVLGRTIFVGLCLGLFWILGASFYFYMPLASMTNPPMNWGYARTWEGFLHALTRGQYERTNPTSSLERFFSQLGMLLEGAVDEFNLVYLLIALLPFFFFLRLQRRERAWLAGLVSMYFCLAVLLMMLLNVSPDRQSREMNRVFFTASHVMIALCVAYGLAIFGGLMATQYQRYRPLGLYLGAVASAIALYSLAVTFAGEQEGGLGSWSFLGLQPSWDPLIRFTAAFTFVLAVGGTALFLLARERPPMVPLIALFVIMPLESIFSHWSDNEQRGHLFGYWFGHDMFAPPFGMYEPMARDAILFGGTDPGRFCPTYMIFCESFTPASKKRDPDFDRRDVYIITQNALADQTYLSYIRAHYFRSAQQDPPFFQGMVGALQEKVMPKVQRDRKLELKPHVTNGLARAVGWLNVASRPLDRFFTDLGARVEARRRAEGVYPPTEIYTPSPEDHGMCMAEYFADADRRRQVGQLRSGEEVRLGEDGKLQVSGQVAVMAINALLTKVIFDRNPGHEFYVEESFPLDWMFPHLEPHGIIMKINREPLAEMTEAHARRDHAFWRRYSERLIGDWIDYDTPVSEVCDFAVRVYERRDYTGFTGDRKFIRDDQAQKSFSKLRSSLGGLFTWRAGAARGEEERARMLREAEFALKQAFAFCPYSPEAVYRYTSLLVNLGRVADAERVAETCLRFDRDNPAIQQLLAQVQAIRGGVVPITPASALPSLPELGRLVARFESNPANGALAFELASVFLAMHRTNDAMGVLERLVMEPGVDENALLSAASVFAEMGQGPRLETTLQQLVKATPDAPEAWYDLASTQAILGKPDEALTNLARAIELNRLRRQVNPAAPDLRTNVAASAAFAGLRGRAEFQRLLEGD
jgi:thioredoxin-like negative regulator of GroEL